jgi:hypothetical protein
MKRFKILRAATSKIMHDKYSSKVSTETFGSVNSHDVQMEDPRSQVSKKMSQRFHEVQS